MSKALYVVTIEVAPSTVAEWDPWHSTTHVPEVLAQPGFLCARKYRDTVLAQDGWTRFVCEYEAQSVEAVKQYLESAASVRLREDHTRRFGNRTRLSRQLLEEVAFVPSGQRA